MNGRFFLASNVFVYSLDEQSPGKAEIARRLIRTGQDSEKGIVKLPSGSGVFPYRVAEACRADANPRLRAIPRNYLPSDACGVFFGLLCGEALRIQGQHGLFV